MTEAEWLASTDPEAMLSALPGGRGHDRKKRLFALACCRTIWEDIPEGVHRDAILVAERHADGLATEAELGRAVSSVHRIRRKRNKPDWAVYHAIRYPRDSEYHYAFAAFDQVARD